MAMLNTLDGVRDETGRDQTPYAKWTRCALRPLRLTCPLRLLPHSVHVVPATPPCTRCPSLPFSASGSAAGGCP